MRILEWSDDPKNPLNNPCPAVDVWDAAKNTVANDMCRYLVDNPGAAAVACNQVQYAKPYSYFAWKNEYDILEVVINPTIVHAEGPTLMREGCLSFPGIEVEVERFSLIEVDYLSDGGMDFHLQLKGFAAQLFQHEIDHLLGLTFLDSLDDDDYGRALEQYQSLARNSWTSTNQTR